MKISFQLILAIFISFIFMSCEKKEIPILEIYVSAKKSELYTQIDLVHSSFHLDFSDRVGTISNRSNKSTRIDLTIEDSPKE